MVAPPGLGANGCEWSEILHFVQLGDANGGLVPMVSGRCQDAVSGRQERAVSILAASQQDHCAAAVELGWAAGEGHRPLGAMG